MFDLSLDYLKIAKSRIDLLVSLGINTTEDLIRYYPQRYEIMEEVLPEEVDDKLIVEAIVVDIPKVFYIRKNMTRMTFAVLIKDDTYTITIFNRHFIKNSLTIGKKITIIGKLSSQHAVLASDIKLNELKDLVGINPIYATKKGLPNASLRKYIEKAMVLVENDIIDFIPEQYLHKHNLIFLRQALSQIHNPKNKDELIQALKHLKYEEFLKFQLTLLLMKKNRLDADVGVNKIFDKNIIENYIRLLPFELTVDQKRVCNEILDDISSNKIMDRLIQGDVGSGKTVVASVGIYANYLAGFQGALMAPTEILAKQHFNSFNNFFRNTNIKIVLLIGSLSSKEKKDIYEKIALGEYDLIIGTHALIQNKLVYRKLGLVIADEQHRFGVNQRKKLQDKGEKVDLLTMSATPIPRTIAMVAYGDKDISTIYTMPSSRKVTKTTVVKSKTMKPILEEFEKYLDNQGQAYIVCPLVDESENLSLKSSIQIHEAMIKHYKDRYRIGLLHGKMSDEQKDIIMNQFLCHELDAIVATTVIEVGVHVDNANMMIIYDAHRFGLSQLHQLRGRVGRSDQQGQCFLLSSSSDDDAISRLQFLENNTDGFKIAEHDLKLRGPGELLGNKQSGLPSFLIADIAKDFNILEHARKDGLEIINNIDDEKYHYLRKYLKNKIENNYTYLD